MKRKLFTTRYIAGNAILLALVCVLASLSNYTPGFMANTNYALVPIAIAACIYGPIAGLFLGLVDGIFCIIAPATLSSFFAVNPAATIVLCLLKTGLAGLAAGYIFKALRQKNKLIAVVLACISLPVVNTGLFLIGAVSIFYELYEPVAQAKEISIGQAIIVLTLTFNFAIETAITVLLAPAVYKIIQIAAKNKNIGSVYTD